MSKVPSVDREQVLKALKIFSDEPDDQSTLFNFDLYSNQLYDLILKDIPFKSFAICLNGEWGSGKTSLIKRVYNRLISEKDDKIKVLWFDAWKYERLDPVLALLQKISFLYGKNDSRLKELMTSLTLVFSDIVLKKTTGLTVNDIQKHFETSVKEVETMSRTLENIIGDDGRLVVFIDDLDRCSVENTLEILESIKLLFNAKNTTFIVAADIRKLELAWTLKHKGTVVTVDEGREHLDKIFQLKLAIPSKISFPREGSEEKVNELIEKYLKHSLTGNLPPDLHKLIVNGFPPNPRKIKRALSLAYFIGKNTTIPELNKFKSGLPSNFKDLFAAILIWSVISLYYFDLADFIRKSPYLLTHVCIILADTKDIGNLRLKIDWNRFGRRTESKIVDEDIAESVDMKHFRDNSELSENEVTARNFPSYIQTEIDPAAYNFTKNFIDNPVLYRFLKSIVTFYDIRRNPSYYQEFNQVLEIIIDSAGLIF